MNIEVGPETPEIKNAIVAGFQEYAHDEVGSDQNIQDMIGFYLRDQDGVLIGAATGRIFWGPFHLKNLWVTKEHRGKGYGRLLVDKVCAYAREQDAPFVHIETLSFQAGDFYKKLGFIHEFTRVGYEQGISMIYMRKDL